MSGDIRSFFGGKLGPKTQTPIREKEVKKEEDSKQKRSKNRKVIEDSDDDEPAPANKKATPKKAPAKKALKQESPKGQETSTSDYFATNSKSKTKPTKTTKTISTKATPTKADSTPHVESKGRSSGRKKASASYKVEEDDDDDFAAILDDEEEGADDVFAVDAKTTGKRKDDGYVEVPSDDEPIVKAKKVSRTTKPTPKTSSSKKEDVEMKDVDDSFVVPDDSDDMMVLDKPTPKRSGKKRKSVDLESEDDDDIKPKTAKSKSSKPPPAKKPRAPKKEPESAAVQAILDNIPTIRAPTPPPKDDSAKYDWMKGKQGGGNAGAAPPAAGSKEIPEGAENCLAGMTFVFTGILQSISREEGQELVKRYGGKVTGAPSSKTTAVVLGSDAGPSKLRKIEELKIRAIDEDGLFAMIRQLPANGGDGKAAEKTMEKKKAEMEKIKKDAENMDREEKKKAAEAEKAEKERQKQAALKGMSAPAPIRKIEPTAQLWTSKYAPTSINQICGNKAAVEKIQNWLEGWAKAHKYNFDKKGPDGLGGYRAIIVHGPPGIGKTTAAHLAAKLAGYDVIESNASDTRSKKLVESGLNDVLDNSSLLGYFAGNGKDVDKHKKNIVLIMDEVDGMSAGDRGGVGALAKVCKKTHIPMILICNDRKLPKMKPFDFVTFDIPFRRPTLDQVRSRIATICHREGLKLPMNVIDALVEGSNKDIRQIINMLSTAKLDQTSMDFDQGKAMSKAWEKHVILKPWDICHKLLGGGMFTPSSKSTLNDKIELYFNDHEFSYLMIQENYLSTKPALVGDRGGREAKLKALQLADQAAESISDGDLVDRMIHGSQQQWSLMPAHAVFSTVRPASFTAGLMTGQTSFTSWLGNNSKQQKHVRYVKEIQSHMRLRTSGDRHEIRQQYLPVLWVQMIKRLELDGKDCVDEVIDLMDSYFLTRDDFDYMMELGLGPQDQERVKLDTQTKSTFTRLYNSRSHPLPFMKASNVVAPAKQKKEAPDLEEAIEEEDEGDAAEEPTKEEAEDIDFKKDKYIKQPKAKKAPAKKAAKKKDKVDEDEVDDEDDEEKPKKKTKAKASTAKGKGKK